MIVYDLDDLYQSFEISYGRNGEARLLGRAHHDLRGGQLVKVGIGHHGYSFLPLSDQLRRYYVGYISQPTQVLGLIWAQIGGEVGPISFGKEVSEGAIMGIHDGMITFEGEGYPPLGIGNFGWVSKPKSSGYMVRLAPFQVLEI